MTSVFVLQHAHALEDGDEDIKFIGVYSSRENAEAAVTRISRESGFSDDPDGFHIDEYQIDRDHWSEGYSEITKASLLGATSENA